MVGSYVDIAGHPTWVDVHGDGGHAVLLLHGGMSHTDAMADVFAPTLLDAGYRVVGFDRRGHGRTADRGGPFHYDDMASDTIAVLEAVVGAPACLIGWSDGGIIALLVALRRPDLIDRLVLIGANFHHDGMAPVDFGDSTALGEQLVAEYAARSPDGGAHIDDVFDRYLVMIGTEPTLTTADLTAIAAPTLVMAGDDDMIRLDHTCALYEALPGGQLAIVPGASHALPLERSALVADLVVDFLAGEPWPTTMLPIRRAGSA